MRLTAIMAATAALVLTSAAHAQAQGAPDATRVRLAQEMMELSGGQKAAEDQVKIIYSNMGRVLEGSMPASAAKLVKVMQDDMQEELLKAIPEMLDISVQAYARHLTEAELRDYIAWLKTDTGRAVLAKQTVILRDVVDAQTPMMRRLIPTIMHKAVQRACDETKCTDEQRQTIAAAVDQMLKGS